ncbi:MAG: BON domain-containing protein [Caldilineales bacterium]
MIRVSTVNESNSEVVWRVHDQLAEEQGLRTTTADIEISGGDQVIVLAGRVRTQILYDLADRIARRAAGSWSVDNRLISDEALTIQTATKAGKDPRTADADVRFDVFLGVAHVLGKVGSQQQHDALLELAGSVPGVNRVEDHTVIAR